MGKLKIIIIVCGIIVIGTIGTVAIVSNNKNSKTNNSSPKTQNQILTTAPSKASTSESVTKSESEPENKTSANSVASNNNASESSSTQSQESTNQVTATNTASNTSNSINSTSTNNATTSKTSNNNSNISKNNINVSSQTQSSNNSQRQSSATFSMATINKNCSLYDATPKYGGMPSLNLTKGQTIFVLNGEVDELQNVPLPTGWVFVRTALGAGYLPTTAFTKTSNINYRIEQVNNSCNLFSSPSENSKIVSLNVGIYSGSLVYASNNNLLKGWSNVFASSSATTFKQGYILNKNLTIVPNSRVEEP